MSELDEVRKRMNRRKGNQPLTDYHFKKLYNGMIRFMVMIVVILSSLIIVKNHDLEGTILNNKMLNQTITKISQVILDYLPQDHKVSHEVTYQQIKDNYYYNNSNEVLSLSNGQITNITKKNHHYIVTVMSDQHVQIKYGRIKNVAVKENQKIKKGMSIGSYQNELTLDFSLSGKKIDYETYQGME